MGSSRDSNVGLFLKTCRTKASLVKEPVPIKSPARRPKHSDEILTSSKSTDTSWNSGSQFSKESSGSAQSLASLRELLPENPNLYTFGEITVARRNFLSGKFGNSSVWRCMLRGKPSVVTERSKTGVNLVDFRAKLRQICNVHHSSIIKILGGCEEVDRLYLVYEYVKGSSLRDCLRGSRVPGYTVLSSWISRLQVAVDVAQGLEYMHHDIVFNYIHNYMKSSNIIVVGDDFRAKITYFGISELSGELAMSQDDGGESLEITEEDSGGKYRRSHSRKITGTQGCMAPEFVAGGIVSQKTDVFAFGIVLLELLSGQEPVRFHYNAEKNQYKRMSLSESWISIVSDSDFSSKLRTWIDPRLMDSYPVANAEKIARLAVMCLDMDASKRPDMRYVAGELSKIYLTSKIWTEKMKANKAIISATFEGR